MHKDITFQCHPFKPVVDNILYDARLNGELVPIDIPLFKYLYRHDNAPGFNRMLILHKRKIKSFTSLSEALQ